MQYEDRLEENRFMYRGEYEMLKEVENLAKTKKTKKDKKANKDGRRDHKKYMGAPSLNVETIRS